LLAEFGIVLPQSPRVLHTYLHDILEDASNDIAAQPALRCSVHSCIGKSSMNIFTGAAAFCRSL
jgi:hypothetical protein